jgi:alpha-tubulin suppressor-like RCC1 family protein
MYCWGKVLGSAAVNKTASFQNITDGSATVIPNLIANGQEHQCVLTPAGMPACTGFGRQGQIGDGLGTSTNANTYNIPLAPPAFYSSIVAGRAFNCGMPRYNPADPTSQIPVCWGYNGSGQLGTGAFLNKLVPTAVTMPATVTAFDSASLAAGAQHMCAMTPAGAGYCWGSNAFGQLGKGGAVTASSRDSIPQLVAAPAGVVFARMYAGESHSCAIDVTGDAYCWGRNDYGQLGNGAPTAFGVGVTSPVLVGGGLKFRSLSLGELFTCGVVAALGSATGPSPLPGTVYCWGDNSYGQIGNGAQGTGGLTVLTPTKVQFQP